MSLLKLPFIFMAISALFLVLSCKKDKDETAPGVTITAPPAQSTFNVFDTIWVSANVSDEKQLSSVLIRFLNSAQVSVLPSVSVSVQSTSFSFNVPLVLSDIHLQTGVHFINVFASDGTNDVNAFREVNIVAAPLVVNRYVAVSRPGAGVVRLDTISASFDIGLLNLWSGDHSTTAVNSWHQQVIVGGGPVSDLQTINAADGSPLWGAVNQNTTGLPYFKDVRFSPELLLTFTTNEDGHIRGYSAAGNVQFAGESPSGFRPQKVLGMESMVIVELEDIVPPLRRLGIYWTASGQFFQDYSLNKEIVFMNPRTDDRLLIFGNNAGQAEMEERDLDSGNSGSLIALPAGLLHDAASINATNYILAHEAGIYRYDYNTSSLNMLSSAEAHLVSYDAVNDLVLAAVGSDLRFLDANTGAQVNAVTLMDDAQSVGVLYNK